MAALTAFACLCCSNADAQVVISQVYGGASSSGSTYTRDFVELFNRGTSTVNLSTWSIQYAAATGTSWTKVNLTGSIAPGGYYLFLGATGTSGVAPPAADLSGTLDMSATTGKVALVANQTALPAQSYVATGVSGVVDFVGYGTSLSSTGPNGFEGAGPTGTATSIILAAIRLNGGCTDTNDNSVDFTTATPSAHNSVSPTNACAAVAVNGACCLATGVCQYLTSAQCAAISGATYAGDYIACAPGSYVVTNTSAALIDISGSGTNLSGTAGGDSVIAPASGTAATAIPFDVIYFGQKFNKFRTDSNGILTLCPTSTTTTGGNAVLPATASPVCMIASYWDDLTTLSTSTGRIYYQTLGSAPTRQFVVQFDKLPWWSASAAGTGNNTSQIIFNESTQVIEFRYGTIIANNAIYTGGTATATFNTGMQNLSRTLGYSITPANLGTGGATAAQQFTPTGECPTTGACCKVGLCSIGSSLSCTVNAGIYSGDGTSCNPDPCAIGACCLPNGTCSDGQTSGQCATNGGIYQGDNSLCSGVACPAVGRCCTGATCTVGFQATCASGDWTAAGTCTVNLCATPCCDAISGACSLVAATGGTCAGTLGTVGATCAATVCPKGSCCNTTTFVCSVTGPSGCSAGTYAGDGTTCTTNPCPAPANDLCANAIALSGSGPFPLQTLGQNVTAADTAAFTPAICASSSHDVWYTFTPADGSPAYSFTLCNTVSGTLDTVLSIHSGCPTPTDNKLQTGLTGNCNDDGCSGSAGPSAIGGLTLTAGQTYWIRVSKYSTGAGGTFRLDITTEPFGSCCTAASVCNLATQSACASAGNIFTGGGTSCSTSGICNGACCTTTTGVCTSTTAASCTGAGQVHGGVGSVCTVTSCPTTTCCNDSTGACTTTGSAACPAGTTANGAAACSPSPCPTTTCCNDTTGACTVTGTAACPDGTTPNAASTCTSTPCPISTCCNSTTGACTTTGTVACPDGTTPNAATSCSPTPCPSGSCCNVATFACTVTGPSGCAYTYAGDGTTCTSNPCPPPSNDTCATPLALTFNIPYVSSNASATGDNTEGPAPSCQASFSHSVWFTFTAPATTNYHVYSCGSLFDNVLTVFSGPDCNTLTQIGCDDDTCNGSEVFPGPGPGSGFAADIPSTPMIGGQTYIIRMSSYSTNSGTYGLIASYVSGTIVGSCCNASGGCSLTDLANCAGSTPAWTADGSCSPNACPQPGACCDASGNCSFGLPGACNGTFTTGGSCSPNTCPQPGSCCEASGNCSFVVQTSCNGVFSATGSCTPNICPQPGTCCDASGGCTLVFQAACSGSFSAGGSCTPNPCPQLGTCCDASGGCTLVFQTACSGVFSAAGSCSPNPCPQPGTCCDASGSCSFVLQAACSGVFSAAGSCTPNPCPQPGVCCRGATCNTSITSAGACTASGTAGAFFATGAAACNSGAVSNSPCCYANYNKINGVTIQDIFDFLADWFAGNPYARVGSDGTPGAATIQNIFDFLSNWFAGGCT
jgi:hypothetical protein